MKRKFDKKKSRNQNSDNVLNKKRVCQFSAANVEEIDYKDIDLLSKFINESGKISPARMTGTSAKYQRQLTTAIKRAFLKGRPGGCRIKAPLKLYLKLL